MTSPSDEYILDLKSDSKPQAITHWSAKHLGSRLRGLGAEEFWFKGADDLDVMGWAIKPKGWSPRDKNSWPLAFLVHGGPQSAWEDAWNTRWNPALFAAQGYFVIMINPSGSTGYGQEFTDRIQNEWGGRPFKDLLAGYRYALKRYPEIDPERTAALGASYGGYMINWINGHNDFGFKALVCHDGLLDTTESYFSTEEVWFPTQEFGGPPWQTRMTYEKWNPINHVAEWSTPQFVIHSAKDYRLVDSQGLGAFTALQVQGVPSRLLYFPDENHWVLKPSNSRRWHVSPPFPTFSATLSPVHDIAAYSRRKSFDGSKSGLAAVVSGVRPRRHRTIINPCLDDALLTRISAKRHHSFPF